MNFLAVAVLLLLLIVLIGFINEKTLKLTYEIALMLFSVVIGGIITLLAFFIKGTSVLEMLSDVKIFDLESFLMDGVLCFMLFAGSCHMKLKDFRRLARPVSVLAFVCTLLGAVIYGLLFYGIGALAHLPFSLPMCLMFGSIVAPTDPIAATSILKKFGLPKDTGFLIEGESLLNDGVGVALFVCFSGIVTNEAEEGFIAVMLKEILGAAVTGIVVTLILYFIFKNTEDSKRRIFISLLNVAAAYYICEVMGFSGAIASVVCGVMFSTLRDRGAEQGNVVDFTEFDCFWEILDNLLNSLLYVMMGFSFIGIFRMEYVLLLSLAAVVCNLIARFSSVFISTYLMGKVPDGFTRFKFSKLLTWGGLRGGLSIALAMSTLTMLPDSAHRIVLGCTYAIAFFTTVVQGLTMKKVYESL